MNAIRWNALAAVLMAAGVLSAGLAQAADELTVKNFPQLYQQIRPQPGESKWAQVAWMTNLGEARRRSDDQLILII